MNGTITVGTSILTKPSDRDDEGSEVVVRFFDPELDLVAQAKVTLSDFALASLANRANVPAEVTLYHPTIDTDRAHQDTREILVAVRSTKDEAFGIRHATLVWAMEQIEAVWAEGRQADFGAAPEGV